VTATVAEALAEADEFAVELERKLRGLLRRRNPEPELERLDLHLLAAVRDVAAGRPDPERGTHAKNLH
jgi:hypothetical protein